MKRRLTIGRSRRKLAERKENKRKIKMKHRTHREK